MARLAAIAVQLVLQARLCVSLVPQLQTRDVMGGTSLIELDHSSHVASGQSILDGVPDVSALVEDVLDEQDQQKDVEHKARHHKHPRRHSKDGASSLVREDGRQQSGIAGQVELNLVTGYAQDHPFRASAICGFILFMLVVALVSKEHSLPAEKELRLEGTPKSAPARYAA